MTPTKAGPSPAATQRVAEATLRGLVAKYAPEHARLVSAVRKTLRARVPTAFQLIYDYKRFFVVSYSATEQGYEGALGIRADDEGVRLFFNGANALPDPEKLLQGAGSMARWLPLENAAMLKRPAVLQLIGAAVAQSRTPFATSGAGHMILRTAVAAASAKKPTSKK